MAPSPTLDFAAALALLAGFTIWLAAYLLRRVLRGGVEFERVRQQGGTPFLSRGAMNAGYWLIQPVARACVAAHVAPAGLSWLSLLPALAAAFAAAVGAWGMAAWGLLASALLDVLDGAVARASARASAAGAILDSTLDRYAEFFFFAGLLVQWRAHLALQLICFAAVAGSVLVTYSTAKAEALHLTPPRGIMKRSDRMACLVVGAMLSPLAVHWFGPMAVGPGAQPWPILAATALIALLGNWSAVVRFRALARQAEARETRSPERAPARDTQTPGGS